MLLSNLSVCRPKNSLTSSMVFRVKGSEDVEGSSEKRDRGSGWLKPSQFPNGGSTTSFALLPQGLEPHLPGEDRNYFKILPKSSLVTGQLRVQRAWPS